MTTIAQIHQAWETASGQTIKPRIWERAFSDFIAHGYTCEDIAVCFRYAKRENARFTQGTGFTITPFKVFDFEYRWFDSLLSQARASERNRRPAPTPKEAVVQLREKVINPESVPGNGAGRHVSEIFHKNITNQMKTEINKLHGGPAFPITMATEVVAELKRTGQEEVILSLIGITKRDYFAAAALPELIRSALDLDHVKWDTTAEHAYIIADEMLKARKVE